MMIFVTADGWYQLDWSGPDVPNVRPVARKEWIPVTEAPFRLGRWRPATMTTSGLFPTHNRAGLDRVHQGFREVVV